MSRTLQLGELRLTLVDDGPFRLDGGAMFGVVPKVLWQRHKEPDDRNRIPMVTNCLLVERGDELLLVDTGIGDKNDARFRQQLAMDDAAVRLPQQIRQAGYQLEDVTHVLLTHLHFDHCGWNTMQVDDKLLPTFPNATYFMCRGEVEHARSPNVRDRASYDPRNWEPLFEAGVVELFDDGAQPITGVQACKAPGHNADMCIVLLDGGEVGGGFRRAAFWADLVPTVAHVPTPWVMGFDLFPLQTMAHKERWLGQAAAEDWLCIFEHETDAPWGRLVEDRPGRWRAEGMAGD